MAGVGTTAGEQTSGELATWDLSDATHRTRVAVRATGVGTSSNSLTLNWTWYQYTPTTAITAIRFYFETYPDVNNIASGTIYMYSRTKS